MSISDDPRGFRRGQPGNSQYPSDGRGEEPKRQPARPDSRNGARPAPARQEEQYSGYTDGNDGPAFAERPAQQPQSQRQPSFSAYRPEAYASGPDKGTGRPARPEWSSDNHFPSEAPPQQRPAAEKRPAPRPQPEPFRPQPAPERPRASQDPYNNAGGDPYDTGRREFDSGNWRDDTYQEPSASQFAASSSYYQHHDDPNPAEVQSVHNRFFAADPEPERAPKAAPAQPAPRYRNDDYDSHDYGEEDRPPVRAAKPAPAPARNAGYDDGGDYRWDSFEQQPQPAPESVRPFQAPQMGGGMAGNEDLDADYFADEDEFEGEEEYAEPSKSGGKKLMAAVLVGAVVTGGGLAYMYKSQVGGSDGGEPPVVAANVRPVKEPAAEPGGREFANGGKLIYDRLDGSGAPSSSADQPARVASRDEAPAEGGIPGVVTTGASGTLEERINNALRDAKRQDDAPDQPITTAANTANPDLPRNVRTDIIRPDGSVETSRNPEPTRGIQRRQAEAEAPSFATAGASAKPAPAAPRQQQRVAELTPPTAPAVAVVSSGGEGGMFVQIAARNDQAAAMAAFADLQQKYAGVLGNHSPSVRKVDLGEKGVWYRLLVGPMASKPDADKLCEDLKAAGMKGCFSRKE